MSANNASTGLLSLEQQIFSLSMLSNIFDMYTLNQPVAARGELQALIDQYVNANAANGEKWVVEWGPVGLADAVTPNTPENTIYVAKNATSGTDYVIATAGTKSHFGIFDEDKKTQLESFQATPDKAFTISQGTIDGINILLGLKDQNGVYLIGSDSANGYLQTIDSNGADVSLTVTGHSLGGALCPALALILYYTRSANGSLAGISQGTWNSAETASVNYFASAGPAVGNQDYVNQLNSACPNSTNVWNCIDIVPHAWWNLRDDKGLCNSTLEHTVTTIKDMYRFAPGFSDYVPSDLVAAVIDGAILKQSGDYVPVNPTPGFSGALQEMPMPSGCTFNSNWYYVAEVLHQHMDAYFIHFQVTDLFNAAFNGSAITYQMACALLQKFYSKTDCGCLS